MDAVGIAFALLSISSPGLHFLPPEERVALAREVNHEGASAVHDHPERFGLLASLPLPDIDATLAEIDHAADILVVDGFSMMTNYDGIYLGDPRFEPVFAELGRRSALVAIHPTSPPGSEMTAIGRPAPMLEFPFDTTRTVFDLILHGTLRHNSSVRVIVPHVGSALTTLADRVQGFTTTFAARGGDADIDVHRELNGLYFDTAGDPFPNALLALRQIVDSTRILYGSDAPFAPQHMIETGATRLMQTDLLTDQTRSQLLRYNALGLIPRLEEQLR
jgi:predicted TIM-barrel fold metal-dependent hydrolase